ncbi:alpha/beta hydrolase [Goodfellowiella coeruleoviolacea]
MPPLPTAVDGPPIGRRRLTRRSLLTSAGIAGLVTVGVVGTATSSAPAGRALREALGAAGPTPTRRRAVTRLERVRSAARGQDVDLLTVLPPNVAAEGLPVVLLLHGLNGSARRAPVGGLADVLATSVVNGVVPPFAFVAVDGGNNYWHENVPGDDPMAMLLTEVPGWLAERGFGGAGGLPVACAGVSMGGFGALVYARRRNEQGQPLRALAVISPGLMTSWQEMSKRHAFANEAAWAALDPLRHVDRLGSVPTGVWIGNRDQFVTGTRQFIRAARPAVASVTPGGHDENFYRKITPDVVRFLGSRLRG